MKPHKHAEALIALADGNIVEWKTVEGHWYKFEIPDTEYRIKPEPKPDKTRLYTVMDFIRNDGCVNIQCSVTGKVNLKLTFDGETGELKSAEVLK